MPSTTKIRGRRRRHRGRMVGPDGKPRSHHIDRLTSPMRYTMGDTALRTAEQTRHKKTRPFLVPAPTKRRHRRGFYRPAEEA